MDVIAEGIETQPQADLLLEYGCRVAQGFLYAAGEPEQAFYRRLRKSPAVDAGENA